MGVASKTHLHSDFTIVAARVKLKLHGWHGSVAARACGGSTFRYRLLRLMWRTFSTCRFRTFADTCGGARSCVPRMSACATLPRLPGPYIGFQLSQRSRQRRRSSFARDGALRLGEHGAQQPVDLLSF